MWSLVPSRRWRLAVVAVALSVGCRDAAPKTSLLPPGGQPDGGGGAGGAIAAAADAAAADGARPPSTEAGASADAPGANGVRDAATGGAPADDARATSDDASERDPEVVATVAAVSATRLMDSVTALSGQTTRNTCSDEAAEGHGIGAAREWIRGQLQAIPGLVVSLDPFAATRCAGAGVTANNVLAVKHGRHPERLIIVGGHYDSRTYGVADPVGRAPGANDSGSQTAVVLEAARLMAPLDLDATVMFVAFAGEEQGLLGSAHLAQTFTQYTAGAHLEAVLNMDIVGGDSTVNDATTLQQFRVYSPGTPRESGTRVGTTDDESPSRGLMRYIGACGARYVPAMTMIPELREDRPGRGGDQSSFISAGFPAVRFIETVESPNAGQPGSHQHSPDDLPMYVTPAYAARVAQVVIAVAINLAQAPPAPSITALTGTPGGPLGLRWSAPAGGSPVDHYVLLARPSTANLYGARVTVAASETSRTFAPAELGIASGTAFYVSIAAVDAAGHQSLFAYPEYRCDGGGCVVPADALAVTARQ